MLTVAKRRERVGQMSRDDALKLARSVDLDLVLVEDHPPRAIIVDYSRHQVR